MAEVATAERGSKKKGPGIRHPRKRVGIAIDMTPMVDIAFLLLIFFMVTTVFRRPLAMEVNIPEPGATVEVPMSNVMTVYIAKDRAMTFDIGGGPPEDVLWEDLTLTFTATREFNPDLIVLVKIHPDAAYSSMVDMMDALDEASISRFSLIKMTDEDLLNLESKS